MYLKKGVSIKLFLLASWRSLTKKAGSGSVIQRYGSEDPDSYQNVFSDPETYCLTLNRFCRSYDFTQPWRNSYLHVLPATPTFLLVARRGNFPLWFQNTLFTNLCNTSVFSKHVFSNHCEDSFLFQRIRRTKRNEENLSNLLSCCL